MERMKLMLRPVRPLNLAGAVLLYWLGAGIAHYLGLFQDWNIFAAGQAWILLLLLGCQDIYDFFQASDDNGAAFSAKINRTTESDRLAHKRFLMLTSFTCLAVLSFLTVALAAQVPKNVLAYLFMLAALLVGVLYAAPPVRLELSGYGELLVAVLAAFGAPAFAFLLQAGELHRLVVMSAVPLTALGLAAMIVLRLRSFAADAARERKTLVVRMGWKSAMTMHTLLVIGAFGLLGLAYYYGLPRFVMTSALLVIPFGGLQMYQTWRIEQGGRPNWKLLVPNALATFGFLAYLLCFSYWIN